MDSYYNGKTKHEWFYYLFSFFPFNIFGEFDNFEDWDAAQEKVSIAWQRLHTGVSPLRLVKKNLHNFNF